MHRAEQEPGYTFYVEGDVTQCVNVHRSLGSDQWPRCLVKNVGKKRSRVWIVVL